MSFAKRNERILWPLVRLVLMAAIIASSITGPRWLTYALVVVAIADLIFLRRRVRWIRRRHIERG